MATGSAFFSPDEADEHMKPVLYEQLQKGLAGQKNRIARKDDGVYVTNILHHVRSYGSKLRYHLLKTARPIVKVHYGLARKPPCLPEEDKDRGNQVQEMLRDYKFAALDTDTIFAALSEWTTGVWVKAKFEGTTYETAFQDMLDVLKDITAGEEESAVFDKKRADWYMDAWSRTSLATVVHNSTNRSVIVMRNRMALCAAHAKSEEEPAGARDGPKASIGGADS
ncbi:hypothetical protein AURDEDRAFT_126028 [Auricularia subglabra TFB-10046 SS5]|nr:hypothetical protein AURDEDRAFT_126028 [Auricularia subglabra TFB-10046 SS5]